MTKAKLVKLYNDLRTIGLSHSLALAAVIEAALSGSVATDDASKDAVSPDYGRGEE